MAFGRMSTKPSMQNLNGKWYTGLIKVKQTYLFFLGEGKCLKDVFSSKIEPGIIWIWDLGGGENILLSVFNSHSIQAHLSPPSFTEFYVFKRKSLNRFFFILFYFFFSTRGAGKPPKNLKRI